VSSSRVARRLVELRGRLRPGPAILDRLTVTQDGRTLRIRFTPAPGVTPHALWARNTNTDEWLRLADVRPASECSVDVDLLTLPVPASEDGAALALALEVEQVVSARSEVVEQASRDAYTQVEDTGVGQVTVRHRVSLGRARRTTLVGLHEIADDRVRVTAYPNSRGGLSVAVDRPLNPYGSVQVSRLVIKRGVLRLRGRLSTRHGDLRSAHLVLKGRTSGRRLTRPIPLAFDAERTAAGYGLRWYSFDVRLDCAVLVDEPFAADDTYDTWFRLTTAQNSQPFEIRVGRTRLVTRYLTRPGWAQRNDRAVAVSPYYTFKAKRTSFNVNHFDAATFRYMRRQLRLRHVTRLGRRGRQIWLIGERPYKAQDNGYWFFRYLREQHPELEAYYVIERDSPERVNVEPLGNVVDFGSREHIRLTLLADKVVGTHHPDFLYPLRTREFDRAVRATRVFLQHGVMGTKWMTSLYGKWAPGFDTDLVIVSSEREREYLLTDFGYEPDEVAVTGLPRFDSLLAGDVPTNPRQLLIMPTWRDWLQDIDAYPESEFHLTWSGLLHDPRLRDLVEELQLEVVFCLHANMQQYRHLFTDAPARVISQGDVDVQRLLKESAMLITDYSSVGFDFGFLHKPIAYFQFDREHFLDPQGSHLDLDEELPGPIFRSATSVLKELAARADAGFEMPPEYVARADRFLAVRDRRNNERVYEAIRATRRRVRLRDRLLANEVVAVVPRYLRRHRLYFPVMRRMFRLVKLFPADANVVLFESGIGKQYADSPRYLYEELVRRRPEMTKVWAYAGRLPSTDANTRVVKRLSPGYYFYLARAKYWINNQSFPHYISRRPDGVYVQTWHGTPLKRMLHDLPQVHGRDAGYVDRATRAAQQWSLLVSPNPFTSEVMRSAFRYTGATLELGYPRNDVLHRPDRDRTAARIRARLGIGSDQRVILYAPTFRDDQVSGGRFTFELPFDLQRMHDRLGEDTVLLLRMHVLIGGRLEIPAELRDVVRDVSSYPEIQELYLISDVLVTDYSSVFFDYASLGRPIVFYAYDLEKYRGTLRGFYLDYEKELPGPIVETEDDLLAALDDLDAVAAGFAERRQEFVERFAAMDDGHAAERVVDAVFGPSRSPTSPSPADEGR
jgi:CDP-glycerol glycerophosphotransferase